MTGSVSMILDMKMMALALMVVAIARVLLRVE